MSLYRLGAVRLEAYIPVEADDSSSKSLPKLEAIKLVVSLPLGKVVRDNDDSSQTYLLPKMSHADL